jgi:hypothetical protein
MAGNDQRFEASMEDVRQVTRDVTDPAGVVIGVGYGTGDDLIMASIATGGDRWSTSFFNLGFPRPIGDLSFFRKSIELIRPFEAFIAIEDNERSLNAYEKQRRFLNFERPPILRWFHYVDSNLADSIGGVDRCLAAPVFKAEQLCDGVLLQVTSEWFDNSNPEHRAVQLEAMRYLGLDD